MELFRLFQERLLANRWRFIILAAVSGMSSAMVLASVNHAAISLARPGEMVRALVIFMAVIALYVLSQKRLMIWATITAEDVMDQLRKRLVDKIRRADLAEVEQLSSSKVYTMISRETKAISDAAPQLMIAVQSFVMIFVIMIYLAYLSKFALSLMVLSTFIGASIHLNRSKEANRELHLTIGIENDMVENLSGLLHGFKEVKMSSLRSDAIGRSLDRLSENLGRQKAHTHTLYIMDFIASQVTFFLMTGVVVFVVPSLTDIGEASLGMITTASLFLIGPVSSVVSAVPQFSGANASAEAIAALEQRLESLLPAHLEPPADIVPFAEDFTRLKFEELTYHYSSVADETGFMVGPISLEIPRGKVVFITGGNGSGKSTLLKLITGLYQPESGSLTLDDRAVGPSNRAAYRMLFSVIFSDNYLFQTLLGHPPIASEEADALLELLEMRGKVQLVDGRFSTVTLSSGQKKRLAMVAALLEHKPIYVFDEWAADQDPHFREKFYRKILPMLKSKGKTIIAVTHDDKYFDAADMHVHMDSGKICDSSFLKSAAPPAPKRRRAPRKETQPPAET